MPLPLLLSVPHGGLWIPPEVENICVLTAQEVEADGDEGAGKIYDLSEHVSGFVKAETARAIVDVNRAADDFRKDGVVKTHTCWDVPVYRSSPSAETVRALLDNYYRPYHDKLHDFAAAGRAVLGIDCHTMASQGPPVGPDAGRKRPRICLSDGDGTLPRQWRDRLADCLAAVFGERPSINDPFQGGFITRSHAAEMPWVQLEFSREAFMAAEEKRSRLLDAFRRFSAGL